MAWLDADWTWRVLSPLLDDDDALSLALYAMETRRRALWRFVVYDDTAAQRAPPRATRMLHAAVAHGCWRAAATIHDELLRARYDGGQREHVASPCDRSTLQGHLAKQGLRYSAPMASFLRRVHFAPVELPPHVMYAACQHGHLDAVMWLHQVSAYDPHLALEWAGKGAHTHVVRWLLTNRKTAQSVKDGIKITWTLKGKEAKALGGFYAWNVHVPEDRTTYAFCASREHGLLPRKNVKNANSLYPLKTWAATNGDIELFERLHEHACGREMSTTVAVVRAAECGQLAVVQWFFDMERPIHKDIEDVTLAALAHGHLHIVQWLYEEDFEIELPLSARLRVRANGFTELDDWLNETFPDPKLTKKMRKQRIELWNNYLIEAASNGLFDVVQFVHEEVGCVINVRTLGNAASHGHLQVLQWLWAKQPPDDADLRFILARAVSGGSLEVVQWLVGVVGLFESSLMKLAVSENHVAVAEYLLGVGQANAAQNNVPISTVFDLNIDLLQLISQGRFEAFEWLLTNLKDAVVPHQVVAKWDFFLTLERYHNENESALRVRNTEFDQLRLFQWAAVASQPRAQVIAAARRLLLALPQEFYLHFEWIPVWAIRTRSLALLKALEKGGHPTLFSFQNLDILLDSTRDASLVQWFLEQEEGLELVDDETTRIVRWAAKYHHVDLLQWVFSRSEELATFRTAVWTAAKHGHISVLQSVARYLETHGLTAHKAFCKRIWRRVDTVAAENGHVEVIEWLHQKTGDSESPLADIAAKRGRLRVLQWLQASSSAPVTYTVRAFCCAVGKGHVETVEWLMRNQPDVVARAFDAVPSLEIAVEDLRIDWKAK